MLTKRLIPIFLVLGIIAVVLFFVLRGDNIIKHPIKSAGLTIETWQTDNGAKVFYVPAPELPIVDIRVVFNAGSARDGDKAGLAGQQ